MPRKPEDPERALSPDEIDSLDAETLRSLLARSDAADLLDAATRARIGQAIARAATRPRSIVPQQQQQQQERAKDEDED